MASQITINLTVCSKVCYAKINENIKAHATDQRPVDTPHCRYFQHCGKHSHAIPHHVDGLVQDCSNSSALAMELL